MLPQVLLPRLRRLEESAVDAVNEIHLRQNLLLTKIRSMAQGGPPR